VKDKDLKEAMDKLETTRTCGTCPFSEYICRTISKDLYGEEHCLLVIVLSEILHFHTDEAKKSREEFKDKAKK